MNVKVIIINCTMHSFCTQMLVNFKLCQSARNEASALLAFNQQAVVKVTTPLILIPVW